MRPGCAGSGNHEDEFPFGGTLLDDALTFCDLTTNPDGQIVTIEERVAEIVERQGPDHVVARTVLVGMPEFDRGSERVRRGCAQKPGFPSSGLPAPRQRGSR